MARKFNGSSDFAAAAVNLSAFSLITIAYSFWADTNPAAGDQGIASYSTDVTANNAFYHEPKSGNGQFWEIGMTAPGGLFWSDRFTWPTAAAWHHFVFVHNRATPQNKAYVDGASAAGFLTQAHVAGTYGNFANSSIYLGRTQTTLYKAGRLANMTVWGGVELTAQNAKALYSGAPAMSVRPDNIIYNAPLYGTDSPEPDYSGNRKSATLTGTSFSNHPAAMCGLFLPGRAAQPGPT